MIFVILALAVYGMSYILTNTDGPFGIFYRLRVKMKALNCIVCTSVWAALILAVPAALEQWWVMLILGCVGVVALIKEIVK